MSLCAKCYEAWKKVASDVEEYNKIEYFPWTHCHHDKGCYICEGLVDGEKIVWEGRSIDAKTCPNCGRRI